MPSLIPSTPRESLQQRVVANFWMHRYEIWQCQSGPDKRIPSDLHWGAFRCRTKHRHNETQTQQKRFLYSAKVHAVGLAHLFFIFTKLTSHRKTLGHIISTEKAFYYSFFYRGQVHIWLHAITSVTTTAHTQQRERKHARCLTARACSRLRSLSTKTLQHMSSFL